MKIIISDINIMINFSFSNLEVMTLYYLMVLPYFWIFWIWPSKCLIVAIDQVIFINIDIISIISVIIITITMLTTAIMFWIWSSKHLLAIVQFIIITIINDH